MTTTTITKPPFEARRIEEQRFEFVLFINDHIICQRYFNIRDYNDDVLYSWDMKELLDKLCGVNNGSWGEMGIIPKYLKAKAVDFMWNNYNPYDIKPDQGPKNIYEKIDNFQFEIKVDKRVVGKIQFPGNLFPPKIRYAVDIKEIIPVIMSEIRYFFSQKNVAEVEANEAL